MTVIGLTGGIASGKSTVGEQLRLLGATLIDADRLGHRSYEPGSPGFEKVVNAFGHEIVGKDGVIDRRILGGKVFGAPGEMERLNTLLWPEIRRLIADELRELRRRDRRAIVVVEAAVLFEAGWEDLFDEVWVVTTPTKIAVERLMARNSLTEAQALSRLGAQMEARERNERASVKIDNVGAAEQLKTRVERAWKALLKRLGDQSPLQLAPGRPTGRTAVAARPKALSRPAAAPAPLRPKAVSHPAPVPARPAASRSASTRATTTATRATAVRPTAARPTAARPTAARSTAARSAPARATAARPTAARPAAARATPARPVPARPAASRAASRPAAARPAAARSAGRSATRPAPARSAPARAAVARPSPARGTGTRAAAPAKRAAPAPAKVAARRR